MALVIARHGNTFEPGQPALRIGRRTDLSLVATGRLQAHALRRHFSEVPYRFGRVLSGPLRRTIETAETIAPDMRVEVLPWLAEIDHGPDEGKNDEEVLARIGQTQFDAWERDATPPPNWCVDPESLLLEWQKLLTHRRGDNHTLVVTSNGIARFALLALRDPYVRPLKLRTGAYGVIDENGLLLWDVRPQ